MNKLFVSLLLTVLVLDLGKVSEIRADKRHISQYIENGRLSGEPIVIGDGVTITPLKWFVEKDKEYEQFSVVGLELLAKNQSEADIEVGHFLIYVNRQMISNSHAGITDVIKPGGTGIWELRMESFLFEKQRIETRLECGFQYQLYG